MRTLFLILALGLSLSPTLFNVGCSHADDDDDDATGADDDAADDDDSEPTYLISGTIDPAEEGITVTCCSGDTCMFSQTDAAGDFACSGITDGAWVTHNIGLPGAATNPNAPLEWASFYDVVTVEGTDISMGTQVIPEMSDGLAVDGGPGTLDFANGVSATWDADLAPPLIAVAIDDLTLGSETLPEDEWATSLDANYEIIAAYVFAPFEMGVADEGTFDLTLPAPGVVEGDSVRIAFAHYDANIYSGEFSWVNATAGTDEVTSDQVTHLGALYVIRE